MKQRQYDSINFEYLKKKRMLKNLYQELQMIEEANRARDKFKYLEDKEQFQQIQIKDIQELSEEELEKKHAKLAEDYNVFQDKIEWEEAEKEQLIWIRSRFKQQIVSYNFIVQELIMLMQFYDKQKQYTLEDKVLHSEKTTQDIPRLELMNMHRIVATDLQVSVVKSQLEAKSQYRSQILDKNHKTLDYEANQVKKLEDEYLSILQKRDFMMRKLERLRNQNIQEELSFNNFIGTYQVKENEKKMIFRMYCLLQLRESVSGIRAHSNVQATAANQVNLDIEPFNELKSVFDQKQILDRKIEKRLELLDQIKDDKFMTNSKRLSKKASILIDEDQHTTPRISALHVSQLAYRNYIDVRSENKSILKRNSSVGSSNSYGSISQNQKEQSNLKTPKFKVNPKKIFDQLFKHDEDHDQYFQLFLTLERSGFLQLDDLELIHLIDKRHVYLESISKLYNELALINKLKVKEYETLMQELEYVENNKMETEASTHQKGHKKTSSVFKRLTYFELKHKYDQILLEIDTQRDKTNGNKKFISQMEANTIELMRKVTFKIKVVDQVSLQFQEGFTPELLETNDDERMKQIRLSSPISNQLSDISQKVITNLLHDRKIILPPGLNIEDAIIINNKELLEMVNIFEDNYWIQPEKAEQRYNQNKSPRRVVSKSPSPQKNQKSRFLKAQSLRPKKDQLNIILNPVPNLNNPQQQHSQEFNNVIQQRSSDNLLIFANKVQNNNFQSPDPHEIIGSMQDSDAQVSRQNSNQFLSSESQRIFLRSIVRKYKFFFLFAYIMKFLQNISLNSKRIQTEMRLFQSNISVSDYNDANNFFKNIKVKDSQASVSDSLQTEIDIMETKKPPPLLTNMRRKSIKIVQNLQNSIFTPMDIKPHDDEANQKFSSLKQFRKNLQNRKNSKLPSNDDSLIQERNFMDEQRHKQKDQLQQEQQNYIGQKSSSSNNYFNVNQNNSLSNFFTTGFSQQNQSQIGNYSRQQNQIGLNDNQPKNYFNSIQPGKLTGYKKQLKTVSTMMKKFEKDDQQYIQVLKSSVEKAHQAIRRTDTMIITTEKECEKCKMKSQHKNNTHVHMNEEELNAQLENNEKQNPIKNSNKFSTVTKINQALQKNSYNIDSLNKELGKNKYSTYLKNSQIQQNPSTNQVMFRRNQSHAQLRRSTNQSEQANHSLQKIQQQNQNKQEISQRGQIMKKSSSKLSFKGIEQNNNYMDLRGYQTARENKMSHKSIINSRYQQIGAFDNLNNFSAKGAIDSGLISSRSKSTKKLRFNIKDFDYN
eukprot:403331393